MTEITYRNVRETDLDAMHDSVSTWPVVRQLGGWPWPPSRDFTKTRAKAYEGDGFVWAICKDDRLIGTVAVTGHEVGYYLHPDHQGQGIMTTSLSRAINAGFEVLERQRLRASTWIDNDASHALLLKFGFFHYQTEYQRSKARGFPVQARRYRLMRDDWQTLRAGGE